MIEADYLVDMNQPHDNNQGEPPSKACKTCKLCMLVKPMTEFSNGARNDLLKCSPCRSYVYAKVQASRIKQHGDPSKRTCLYCKERPVQPENAGMSADCCHECSSLFQRALDKTVAQGLCTHCKRQPARTGRRMCQLCVNQRTENDKQRQERAGGLCILCCKQPPKVGFRTCVACLEKRAHLKAQRRRRRYGAGAGMGQIQPMERDGELVWAVVGGQGEDDDCIIVAAPGPAASNSALKMKIDFVLGP